MVTIKAKDRCECTLAPYQPTVGHVVRSYREAKPDPLSGRGRCSRRAKTTSAGLNVCVQHARLLGKTNA